MKRTLLATLSVVAMAVVLVGCSESPQTLGGRSAAKRDAAPYTGTERTTFNDAGYKAGDRNGWAQHLKARAQNSQSDYQRIAN